MGFGLKKKKKKKHKTFYLVKMKRCRGRKKQFVLFSSLRGLDPFLLEGPVLLINLSSVQSLSCVDSATPWIAAC